MTQALNAAFPEHPPYGGVFDEIVPHLTIAHGDLPLLAGIERELRASLPVRVRVERAWLLQETPAGWRRRTAFPLS